MVRVFVRGLPVPYGDRVESYIEELSKIRRSSR